MENLYVDYYYTTAIHNNNLLNSDDYTTDYFYRDAIVAYAATV